MDISNKSKNKILKATIKKCKNLSLRNDTIAGKKEKVFKYLNDSISKALKGEDIEDK